MLSLPACPACCVVRVEAVHVAGLDHVLLHICVEAQAAPAAVQAGMHKWHIEL